MQPVEPALHGREERFPAQNEGSIGVMGDCSVAKKSVMSGSDSTRRRRSGWMNRRSSTTAAANPSPISMSRSRARLAGNTLTTNSVHAEPRATGMIEIPWQSWSRRTRGRASSHANADEHGRHEDDDHP